MHVVSTGIYNATSDARIIGTKFKSDHRTSSEGEGVLGDPSSFAEDCLRSHNLYRARHSAPPLHLSRKLCTSAQRWANHLAQRELVLHKGDKMIGENIFCRNVALQMKISPILPDIRGEEVAAYWYSDIRHYRFNLPDSALQAHSGSYSQMVWRGSKVFGIGKAFSRSGKIIVVAHYHPPGNNPDDFRDNVLPLNTRALASEIVGNNEKISEHINNVPDGRKESNVHKMLQDVGVNVNSVLAAQPPNITGRNATKIIAAKILGLTATVVTKEDDTLEVIVLPSPSKTKKSKNKANSSKKSTKEIANSKQHKNATFENKHTQVEVPINIVKNACQSLSSDTNCSTESCISRSKTSLNDDKSEENYVAPMAKLSVDDSLIDLTKNTAYPFPKASHSVPKACHSVDIGNKPLNKKEVKTIPKSKKRQFLNFKEHFRNSKYSLTMKVKKRRFSLKSKRLVRTSHSDTVEMKEEKYEITDADLTELPHQVLLENDEKAQLPENDQSTLDELTADCASCSHSLPSVHEEIYINDEIGQNLFKSKRAQYDKRNNITFILARNEGEQNEETYPKKAVVRRIGNLSIIKEQIPNESSFSKPNNIVQVSDRNSQEVNPFSNQSNSLPIYKRYFRPLHLLELPDHLESAKINTFALSPLHF